jgi:hypothetical protein
MKHNIWLLPLVVCFLVTGCKSNPNKAEKIDTTLTSDDKVSGSEKVGVNKDGNMVVMDKGAMSEKLRDLQNTVYGLEDQVYGTRKFNTQGLYGDLKNCLRKLSSKQYGGSGQLVWTEPLDRVTDKEEELKIGLDGDKKSLVGVSEEFLRDRIARFQGYKMILQKRHDEYADRIEECQGKVGEAQFDKSASNKVTVVEASKAQTNKDDVNKFMCAYAKPGASLQSLLINAFAKGWLSLSDFGMNQNVTISGMKDAKGTVRDNGFMFNGWKLAYDKGPLSVGDVMSDGKDAQLVAWTYNAKAEVKDAGTCLKSQEGVWNQ